MLTGHKPTKKTLRPTPALAVRKKQAMELDLEELQAAQEDAQWCVVTPEMLYLRGAITRAKTDEIIRHILLMNSEASNAEKITLFVDSGGGDMAAAYGLISVMRASIIPINTVAIGCCASAALMISMAGKYRQVDKYCTIMSHIFSTANSVMMRPGEVENWVNSLELDRNSMVNHYVECTALTNAEVQAKLIDENKDIYLTAEEAVGYNMFDAIFKDYDTIHSSTREFEDEVDGEASFLEELNKELAETKKELQQLRELVNTMHSTLYFNSNKRINPHPNTPSWNFGPPTAVAYATTNLSVNRLDSVT